MLRIARLTTSILGAASVVAVALGLFILGGRAQANEPLPPANICGNCGGCYPNFYYPVCTEYPDSDIPPEGDCWDYGALPSCNEDMCESQGRILNNILTCRCML